MTALSPSRRRRRVLDQRVDEPPFPVRSAPTTRMSVSSFESPAARCTIVPSCISNLPAGGRGKQGMAWPRGRVGHVGEPPRTLADILCGDAIRDTEALYAFWPRGFREPGDGTGQYRALRFTHQSRTSVPWLRRLRPHSRQVPTFMSFAPSNVVSGGERASFTIGFGIKLSPLSSGSRHADKHWPVRGSDSSLVEKRLRSWALIRRDSKQENYADSDILVRVFGGIARTANPPQSRPATQTRGAGTFGIRRFSEGEQTPVMSELVGEPFDRASSAQRPGPSSARCSQPPRMVHSGRSPCSGRICTHGCCGSCGDSIRWQRRMSRPTPGSQPLDISRASVATTAVPCVDVHDRPEPTHDWRRREARRGVAVAPEALGERPADDDPAVTALDVLRADATVAQVRALLPRGQAEVILLASLAGSTWPRSPRSWTSARGPFGSSSIVVCGDWPSTLPSRHPNAGV